MRVDHASRKHLSGSAHARFKEILGQDQLSGRLFSQHLLAQVFCQYG
jgi:hypothetical protein